MSEAIPEVRFHHSLRRYMVIGSENLRHQQGQVPPLRQIWDERHERASLLRRYWSNSNSRHHYDLPNDTTSSICYIQVRDDWVKSVATPLDRNLKVDADSGTTECEPTHYQQLVGSLIYLTITRRDLSYPISLLSQFMQTPRDIHLDCAKRVLWFVIGTTVYDVLFKSPTPIQLEGCTIAD